MVQLLNSCRGNLILVLFSLFWFIFLIARHTDGHGTIRNQNDSHIPCRFYIWDMVKARDTCICRRECRKLVKRNLILGIRGYFLLVPEDSPFLKLMPCDPSGLSRCAVCHFSYVDHLNYYNQKKNRQNAFERLMRSENGELDGVKLTLQPTEWLRKIQQSNEEVKRKLLEEKSQKSRRFKFRKSKTSRMDDTKDWVNQPSKVMFRFAVHTTSLKFLQSLGAFPSKKDAS
mmetsp:Transcript_18667/g.24638  ORF Transcript_18667/g.24638 Transcript_18667/m.24638 type:complete len:229 (-) Transcript_18667:319-1005(-)